MRPLFYGLVALGFWMAGNYSLTGAEPASLLNVKPIAQLDEAVRQAERGSDLPALVTALNDDADGYLRIHDFAMGEKLRLQVLRLEEDKTGRDSLPTADALLNLGWFYGNMARYDDAQESLDRCLDIRQHLLGEDSAPVAEVLNALAVLEENRSNFALAEAFYKQSIGIREKVLGRQSEVTATTWNNLATLYWIIGDYESAQKLFSQALAVRQKTVGPQSLAVASTLNNLALLDSSLGDYPEAEEYFQQALRIRQSKLGPEHPLTITTLSQLGLLYAREGDDARAEPLLVQTVALQQKTYRSDHPDLARGLFDLGLLYDRRKLYDRAEPLLLRSLAIRRKILGEEDPEYAAGLAALARHDHALGRLSEALPLYQQALKIDTDAFGSSHEESLQIATDLAYLKIDLGQRADALRLAQGVGDSAESMLNHVFTFAPERQRIGFEQTLQPVDLPAAVGDSELLAQIILRTKGVVLDSLLEDATAKRVEADHGVGDVTEKKRLLAVARSSPESSSSTENAPTSPAREKLAMEAKKSETDADQKDPGRPAIRRALSVDIGDVRAAIPDHAVLVEYVAYQRYLGRLNFTPGYGALILTPDHDPAWIPFGDRTPIDSDTRTVQKYMRHRVREATLALPLHRLYQALVQPVRAGLSPSIHRLIISPDSELNLISFAALLAPSDRFLVEDCAIDYVASGRDLLNRNATTGGDHHFVIFADPDYSRSPGATIIPPSPYEKPEGLSALPGANHEASALGSEAAGRGMKVDIYRGAEASEANLARQDSPYILHLATHGFYLDAAAMPASVPATTSNWIAGGESMSRSVQAFAGASLTLHDWRKGVRPPPQNDGVLSAQEAADLHLDHTWLVVLSACDTDAGVAPPGEGVLGLRRGFAEAGAQNVLLTLWPIDDEETANVMEDFYHEVLKTGDAPAALADVQKTLLVELRTKEGLSEAVRKAGPFILSH